MAVSLLLSSDEDDDNSKVLIVAILLLLLALVALPGLLSVARLLELLALDCADGDWTSGVAVISAIVTCCMYAYNR